MSDTNLSGIEFNNKEYALFKQLVEDDDHSMTTSDIRVATEEDEDSLVIALDNNDVNNYVRKWSGKLQTSDLDVLETKKSDDDMFAPKIVTLKEGYVEAVEEKLDEFDPEVSFDGFNSVSEALDFLLNEFDNTRTEVKVHERELEQVQDALETIEDEVSGMKGQISKLESENEELEELVSEHEEALRKLRENVRPVVKGMASHLDENTEFNLSDYTK